MKDRDLSDLTPLEVYLRASKGEEIPPAPEFPCTLAEYINLAYKAELDRLERRERLVKPKRTRADYHGLRVIRGGKD